MTLEMEALRGQIQDTVSAIQSMERQLQATQAEVQKLGFIARGFVEKDINGATGRGLNEWLSAASTLRGALAAALQHQDASNFQAARRGIDDEIPRLARLRAYLQGAPQKVNMVPAAVLKPPQRTEFLSRVREQEQGLAGLEARLTALSHALA